MISTKASSMVQLFVSNVLGYIPRRVPRKPQKCTYRFPCLPLLTSTQTLFQEAVVWKRLEHQNIVPFLGITPSPLQLISEWMSGGDLTEHIKKHLGADRIALVGHSPSVPDTMLTPATSCLTSLMAFTTSIPATSSTAILRGYVIAPSPVCHCTDTRPAEHSRGCRWSCTYHGFWSR